MTHSRLRELESIRDTARTRRAHLSSRAMLALFVRMATASARLATRLRARLDPTGGAEMPIR